jgi:hypothetical protein
MVFPPQALDITEQGLKSQLFINQALCAGHIFASPFSWATNPVFSPINRPDLLAIIGFTVVSWVIAVILHNRTLPKRL